MQPFHAPRVAGAIRHVGSNYVAYMHFLNGRGHVARHLCMHV